MRGLTCGITSRWRPSKSLTFAQAEALLAAAVIVHGADVMDRIFSAGPDLAA
jgi:hypothetical protein